MPHTRLLLLAVFSLVGCNKGGGDKPAPSAKAEPSAQPTTTKAPEATEATEAPEAPEAPEVTALDQALAIPALGVTVSAPGCTQLEGGSSADPDAPARISPKDPSCRGLPVMGVTIGDAGTTFATVDKAKEFVEHFARGKNPSNSTLPDGYRLAYERGRTHGHIVATKLGSRIIVCRGEGTDPELATIDAICASLAVAK